MGRRCDETNNLSGERRWVAWYEAGDELELYGCFVWAVDAQHAAEVWAEHGDIWHDQWEVSAPFSVWVRPDAALPGTEVEYKVEREYEPTYSAKQRDGGDDG